MTNATRVGLDADGILCDLETAWQTHAEQILGRPIPKVSNHYAFTKRLGITSSEEVQVWASFARQWSHVPMYDHAHKLVYGLEDLGCEVFVITAIHPRHHRARALSLLDLIPEDHVICVHHEDMAAGKAAVLERLEATAFLDDHPGNVNAAMHRIALPVWMDHGYQGLEAPIDGVTVINDVLDFPMLVEQFLRRTRMGKAG